VQRKPSAAAVEAAGPAAAAEASGAAAAAGTAAEAAATTGEQVLSSILPGKLASSTESLSTLSAASASSSKDLAFFDYQQQAHLQKHAQQELQTRTEQQHLHLEHVQLELQTQTEQRFKLNEVPTATLPLQQLEYFRRQASVAAAPAAEASGKRSETPPMPAPGAVGSECKLPLVAAPNRTLSSQVALGSEDGAPATDQADRIAATVSVCKLRTL
jgi:hypothetical protein